MMVPAQGRRGSSIQKCLHPDRSSGRDQGWPRAERVDRCHPGWVSRFLSVRERSISHADPRNRLQHARISGRSPSISESEFFRLIEGLHGKIRDVSLICEGTRTFVGPKSLLPEGANWGTNDINVSATTGMMRMSPRIVPERRLHRLALRPFHIGTFAGEARDPGSIPHLEGSREVTGGARYERKHSGCQDLHII